MADTATKYDETDQQEVFDYLTEIRDGGSINMMGASTYLQDEFGFDRRTARAALMDWMKSR